MGLASLLRVGASYDLGAVSNGLLGMEGSLLTSETLVDDLGVGVDLQVLDGVGIVAGTGRVGEAADELSVQHGEFWWNQW